MADVPEWLRGLTRTFFYSQIGKLKEKGLLYRVPGTYAIGVLISTNTEIESFSKIVLCLSQTRLYLV